MADVCNDNRFELIEKYKKKLVIGTNIDTDGVEMLALDNILFRFWQMGWLDIIEAYEKEEYASKLLRPGNLIRIGDRAPQMVVTRDDSDHVVMYDFLSKTIYTTDDWNAAASDCKLVGRIDPKSIFKEDVKWAAG